MTITKFSCFLSGFLEKKEVVLARLTTNVYNPGHNFRDSESLILTFEKDIARRPFRDAQSLANAFSSSKFSALISKFVAAFVSRSGDASDDIKTTMAITYELLNTEDKFEEVCQDESVQKWLEKAIEYGKDVFFIIGFHTLLNAKVNTANEEESSVAGSLQAPMTTAITHGGSEVLPLGKDDVLDVKVGIERNKRLATAATFTSLGERVVAVEYQKLEFSLFSSKTVESARLGKPFWSVLSKDRGAEADQLIEARLGSFEESKLSQVFGSKVEISMTSEGDIFIIDERVLP